jgi:hypothetical protein
MGSNVSSYFNSTMCCFGAPSDNYGTVSLVNCSEQVNKNSYSSEVTYSIKVSKAWVNRR